MVLVCGAIFIWKKPDRGLKIRRPVLQEQKGEKDMYEKVRTYVKEHRMLKEKDTIIAGISGGPDSVCLFYMLLDLAREYDAAVVAVHVNHGIRGEEAEADEAFVRNLCREKKVVLEVFNIDVRRLAAEEGLSQEEAGRLARRRAFEEAAGKYQAGRIALAHQKNDNAETLLLNLARGTGLRGMGGIRPCAGRYIRPLLCVSREEIEAYLEKNHISYCMDATNYEDTYTRNRIRNHILPYMEKQINPKSTDHLCRAAEQMRLLWEYIEQKVLDASLSCVRWQKREGRKEAVISAEKFGKTEEILRLYLLRYVLEQVSGRKKDLEMIHMKELERLFDKQVGKQLDLPYGMRAARCYEEVRITSAGGSGKKMQEQTAGVRMRILEAAEIQGPLEDAIPKTPYTKWFDYDIIKNSVTIRNRRSGDYITIDKKGSSQKLNRYFINAKIPAEERDTILLAADGDHIMWVIGYRRGQGYDVTSQTKKILEITIDKEGE